MQGAVRTISTVLPSSHGGTGLGPAIQRTFTLAAIACSSGRHTGESSVMPTISIGPNRVGTRSSRRSPADTRSAGRFIAGGSASRAAPSSAAIEPRRGCSPARDAGSMPARHALRSVSAAALTIPGRTLIPSSSPSPVCGRTDPMASRRASSSIGRENPPASRAASCSKVITCSPCRRSRAASSRSSRIASRLCAIAVRRLRGRHRRR